MHEPVTLREYVFTSYSRKDEQCVAPVVEFLRAFGVRVFRDRDNISPGTKWELVLADELENSTSVVVFWSRAASTSEWVKKECSEAIQADKRVIPVVLDKTQLPDFLQPYQSIDFQPVRFSRETRSLYVGSLLVLVLLAGMPLIVQFGGDVVDVCFRLWPFGSDISQGGGSAGGGFHPSAVPSPEPRPLLFYLGPILCSVIAAIFMFVVFLPSLRRADFMRSGEVTGMRLTNLLVRQSLGPESDSSSMPSVNQE
jgi:hypothetical protein